MARINQRTITAAERALEALKLRKAGLSYSEIATALAISKSGAHKAVNKALAELRTKLSEQAENLKTLELDRLDTLQRSLWNDALKGNPQSVDKVLKVMERRARMLGLDLPAKIANTDPTGEQERSGIYLLPSTMTPEDWLDKYGHQLGD